MSVPTSAVGLLNEGVFRSYADLIARRRKACGVPNVLLRELSSLHSNTTFRDIEPDFKRDIDAISKQLLAYINASGFVVVPKAN